MYSLAINLILLFEKSEIGLNFVCLSFDKFVPISCFQCSVHPTFSSLVYFIFLWYLLVNRGHRRALVSKSTRGGEEEECLVSALYACASFTQILGKPYSVCAFSVSKQSSLMMRWLVAILSPLHTILCSGTIGHDLISH